MSSLANTTRPVRSISPQPMSVLDVFVPGLTHALGIGEQLLVGELSYYAYFLCIIGFSMYLSKSIGKLSSWLEPHLSQL